MERIENPAKHIVAVYFFLRKMICWHVSLWRRPVFLFPSAAIDKHNGGGVYYAAPP